MDVRQPPCAIYDCSACDYSQGGLCLGCWEENQRLRESSGRVCAVYECALSQNLLSCLECSLHTCVLRRKVESICPVRMRFEKQRWWAGRMWRALERRRKSAIEKESVSPRVIGRLRRYLQALDLLASQGCNRTSSWRMAGLVGVDAALIRKDLARFGELGTPSYGYNVDYLRERVKEVLRLTTTNDVIWIGAQLFRFAGPLGSRLAEYGCRIVALFDVDTGEVGSEVDGIPVRHVDDLQEFLGENCILVAVLAVCGEQAHVLTEKLIMGGVRGILNLSGEILVVPDSVRVRDIDLVGELIELCYYCSASGGS
ncbi:MAG: redox-sensing transcriptional repressor Rex [Armatimonadota bacterium]